MRPFLKHFTIAIVIFITISAVFTIFSPPNGEEPKEVSLSALATEINEGKVSSIIVEQSKVTIELTDGTKQISRKENDASLTETLRNFGVSQIQLNGVELTIQDPSGAKAMFLALLPFLIPFLFIGLILWFMMRQAQRGNMQAMSFGQAKAKLANPFAKKKITFDDVAGVQEAKEELEEIVDFLKKPQKFIDIGAQIPRGVLMMGPPGTGKTLLARAIAGEANVPFFYISGSDFVEMFVGVGASRVRDLFETAKKNAPAIIFVDELDAVGRHRGAGLGGGNDEREQTLNQILVEMDGFEKNSNVIVVAATNRPDILDPALLRPGRFDRRITLDLPDIKDREKILKLHTNGKKMSNKIDLKTIAQRTPGFSGADLASLINEGALLAARRGKKVVEQSELTESIERVLLGPERKSHVLNDAERKITAYHEGGHAIVAARLEGSDPVHKISIVSRGKAGGFTMKLPSEDRHFHSRTQFIADLAVAMGGYAAEEIIFDELTTGASNDLERATQLARNLVTRFGMSKKLGPVTFGEKEELVFLGRDLGEKRNYSEEIASLIDNEVRSLMKDAHKTALQILKKERDLLVVIANTLLEQETIEREQFEQLVGITRSSTLKQPEKHGRKNILESLPGIGKKAAQTLKEAGFSTIEAIASASLKALTTVEGIGGTTAKRIKLEARKHSDKKSTGKTVRVQIQTE